MKHVTFLFVLVPLVWLASCYPYPDQTNYTSDFDAVYTAKSPRFLDNKAGYRYYAIVDSIEVKNGKPNETKWLDPAEARPILNQVKSRMNAYGYIEVDDDTVSEGDPIIQEAVYMNVVAIEVTTIGASWYPCWGYGWGGWWGYPGWGPGWGGYPCYYPTYYSYSTGTVLVDMIDIARSEGCDGDDDDCNIELAWTSTLNGLLTSSSTERAVNMVDQAFDQSPYLDKN